MCFTRLPTGYGVCWPQRSFSLSCWCCVCYGYFIAISQSKSTPRLCSSLATMKSSPSMPCSMKTMAPLIMIPTPWEHLHHSVTNNSTTAATALSTSQHPITTPRIHWPSSQKTHPQLDWIPWHKTLVLHQRIMYLISLPVHILPILNSKRASI